MNNKKNGDNKLKYSSPAKYLLDNYLNSISVREGSYIEIEWHSILRDMGFNQINLLDMHDLLDGTLRINPSLALRLAQVTKEDAYFWMELQHQNDFFELEQIKNKH